MCGVKFEYANEYALPLILYKTENKERTRRVVGSNPIWGSDFFYVL